MRRNLTWSVASVVVFLVVFGAHVVGSAGGAERQNLLLNPGFDADLSGWSWQASSATHQPGDGVSGPGSAEMVSDTNNGNAFGTQCVDVSSQPSRAAYVFGVWFKPVDFEPGAYGSYPIAGIGFYAGADCTALLDEVGEGGFIDHPLGDWRRHSWGGRAPTGTASILVSVGMTEVPVAPTARTVRIDDAFLSIGTQPVGLAHLWPFDGDATDIVGRAACTVFGAPTYSPGIYGQSISLNGSTDYVEAQVDINATTMPTMTVGAWARSSATGQPARNIVSHDDGWYDRTLVLDNIAPGGVGWSAFTGTGAMGGDVPAHIGEWEFVAVAYDEASSSAMLYVNGTKSNGTTAFDSGFPYIHIGDNPGFGYPFFGLIDEVFIFDRALTPEELDFVRVFGLPVVFFDDFESGSTSAWSNTVP
jgi:hypothetical protein